jgi:hypothetical protein
MEQCFPEGTFRWQNWTHSHIQVNYLPVNYTTVGYY